MPSFLCELQPRKTALLFIKTPLIPSVNGFQQIDLRQLSHLEIDHSTKNEL